MGRGIFFGLIWGGLVSVLGLTVASILGETPAGTLQSSSERVAAVTDAQTSAEPDAPVVASVTVQAPQPPAPPPMGVAQPQAPVADTNPLSAPETSVTVAGPVAPEAREEQVAVVSAEEPILPSPQATPPTVVASETAPSAETEVPVAEPVAQVETPEVIAEDPPVVVSDAPKEPSVPVAEDVPSDAAIASTSETDAPGAEKVVAPLPDAEPSVESNVIAEASADPVIEEDTATVDQAPEPERLTDDASAQRTQAAAPSGGSRLVLQSEQGSMIGRAVGTFNDRATNVETGRLPTITIVADAPAATQDPLVETDPNAPPLERFAAPWENPENLPLMSILLIDDGQNAVGTTDLMSFPYPVSIAVSATAPDATDRMNRYRSQGFEVLALADLPQQAAPADIEVGLEATLANVPNVTGVLIAGDVPGGRQGTQQIIEKLSQSGHGLVTASEGLNTTEQLASSTGFPAANVFDDMDGKDQSDIVIRRFLDNAAFRAAQGQQVIMLGRLRPPTVTALAQWARGDRARRVALVPVSAVLTSN